MLTLSFTPLRALAWLSLPRRRWRRVLPSSPLVARGRTAVAARRSSSALVLAALANPSLVREDREPREGHRRRGASTAPRRRRSATAPAMTDPVRAELSAASARLTDIEPRFIDVPATASGDDGTRLFAALSNGLADVPPDGSPA